MDKIHGNNRRRYLRYRPDHVLMDDLNKRALECTGFVDLKMDKEHFDPRILGMVTDKSHSGCSLALVGEEGLDQLLKPGVQCVMKAGPLDPLLATVRWFRPCGEGLIKVGFEFDE